MCQVKVAAFGAAVKSMKRRIYLGRGLSLLKQNKLEGLSTDPSTYDNE